MPCTTQEGLSPQLLQARKTAVERLREAIAAGTVSVVIGKTGGIAFKGWRDNQGVSDLCAYRMLANTPELRRAVMRAEVTAQTRLNPMSIASGTHSHDGGQTWGRH